MTVEMGEKRKTNRGKTPQYFIFQIVCSFDSCKELEMNTNGIPSLEGILLKVFTLLLKNK